MKKFLRVILATVISFSTLVSVAFAANDYDSYRAEVNRLNDMAIPIQKQAHRMENSSGICNVVAATQLLNRRIAYDLGNSYNSSSSISLSSVITQCGNTVHQVDVVKSGSNRIWYSYSGNGTTQWYNYSYTMPNGFKYAIKLVKKSQIKGNFNDYLTKLLMEHPEGVHYRTPKGPGGHCIVITDFIKNGKGYTFYAIDGTDYRNYGESREEWTKTSTVWHNGATDLYKDMDYIAYIDVTNNKTHTCPTTPKNNKGQWNFQTKGSKLGACKACGKEYDWLSKIQPIINKKATLKSSKKSYKVTLYKKPYEDAGKAASGKVIKELPVTGTVKNAYGTDWYEVEYQKNKKGYITKTTLEKNYDIGSVSDKSAKKTSTQQESAKSTLKINLTQYPSQHTQGNNFGLRGTVTSNYKITSVKGTVVDSKGKTQLSSNDKPNATSMDIKTSALNNSLSFNKLPVGKYTLKIVAVDSSGKKVEDSKTFTVKAKANQSNSSKKEKTVKGTVKIPSSWDNLSIRKGPSTSYKIVGSMKNGAKCTVYPDKTKDGWYYVKYNDVEGYAAGNRINLQ